VISPAAIAAWSRAMLASCQPVTGPSPVVAGITVLPLDQLQRTQTP
jgi:hypothetical protein